MGKGSSPLPQSPRITPLSLEPGLALLSAQELTAGPVDISCPLVSAWVQHGAGCILCNPRRKGLSRLPAADTLGAPAVARHRSPRLDTARGTKGEENHSDHPLGSMALEVGCAGGAPRRGCSPDLTLTLAPAFALTADEGGS